ncbi:MAG: heme-binding protein [Marivivens sp.]|nr:heme-binding protein [Marivivens sp.]
MQITLSKSKTIIESAFSAAADENLKPLAIAVLDAGGHVVAYERQDGAPVGRFEVARNKAYGCLMMGEGGRALEEMDKRAPTFTASLAASYGGKFLASIGGVLMRDKEGNIVGAIGVTGDTSEKDAEVGMIGVEAAGFIGEA